MLYVRGDAKGGGVIRVSREGSGGELGWDSAESDLRCEPGIL